MTGQAKLDAEKIRVQFDLLPSQVAALENLMTICGLDTRKDLVNNALTLMEWAVEQVRLGKEVAALSKAEKSYEVLRMPALIAASRYASPASAPSITEVANEQRRAVAAAAASHSTPEPAHNHFLSGVPV
jgi:hypothetical protein